MTDSPDAQVATLLQQALTLHRHNKLDDAKRLYSRILAIAPDHVDALHLLGVTARQQGDPATAVALISHALGLNAGQPTFHCNLGAALGDLGRLDEALASYQRAVVLKPDYVMAICNLGNTQRKLGRTGEAAASYQRALVLDPAYPEAHCHMAILQLDAGQPELALASADNALRARPRYAQAHSVRGDALQALHQFAAAADSYDRSLAIDPTLASTWCARGTALQRLQCYDDALASYEHALALQPVYALAHQYRGNSLRALGRVDEAIAAYRMARTQGGDADELAFALASLGEGEAPSEAPAAYVATLFDNYADHFDEHLVDRLGYRVPALLDAAIRRHLSVEQGDTLDTGCGTGLCAPLLRPYSRTLAGVDLSEKMLARAQALDLYDALFCSELGAYLAGCTNRFDLIVAADVFVYLGELGTVFSRTSQALRPGGLFSFSVEACDGVAFRLTSSHRYAHSLDYLRALAEAYHFEVLEAEPIVGRYENSVAVPAFAVVMRSGMGMLAG